MNHAFNAEKGFTPIVALVLLVIIIVGIGGIFYFLTYEPFGNLSNLVKNQNPSPIPENQLKKFENKDFVYTFNYSQDLFAIETASPSATTSIQYCPTMRVSECDFQYNVITIQEFPNHEELTLDTWMDKSSDSFLEKDDSCWNDDLRTTQDAGKYQGFEYRAFMFKLDVQSLNGVCSEKQVYGSGNMEYKFIAYGDKIIFIKISNASDAQFYALKQIVSTISLPPLPEKNTDTAWKPVCKSLDLKDFSVGVDYGDGITNISRKAINQYFNNVTLSSLNSKTPRLNAQENTYAEDYIRKHVKFGSLTIGKEIPIPCSNVEEATLKARLLSVDQKENISKYSDNVSESQIEDIIDKQMEILFQQSPELREHSGSLKVQ